MAACGTSMFDIASRRQPVDPFGTSQAPSRSDQDARLEGGTCQYNSEMAHNLLVSVAMTSNGYIQSRHSALSVSQRPGTRIAAVCGRVLHPALFRHPSRYLVLWPRRSAGLYITEMHACVRATGGDALSPALAWVLQVLLIACRNSRRNPLTPIKLELHRECGPL